MVSLAGNVDAQQFAQTHGLNIARQFVGVENTWLFDTASLASATRLSHTLTGSTGVICAFQNQSTGYELSSFVPNGPYFNNPAPPNDYGGQWHLGNNLGGVPHVNIAGAWNNNVTGAGVMTGIADKGESQFGYSIRLTKLRVEPVIQGMRSDLLQLISLPAGQGFSIDERVRFDSGLQ